MLPIYRIIYSWVISGHFNNSDLSPSDLCIWYVVLWIPNVHTLFQYVIYNNILLALEILLDNMDYSLTMFMGWSIWYCWIIIKVVGYTVNPDYLAYSIWRWTSPSRFPFVSLVIWSWIGVTLGPLSIELDLMSSNTQDTRVIF